MQLTELYNIYRQHPSIKTDTRSLQPGDLFFALKGPSFNGNHFAAAALQAGAAYVIADEYAGEPSEKIIVVADVLSTLQALAKMHRQQFAIPFIGITGSNGKTTTKELAHAVLSNTFKTYTTEGNLNNHIGVPLTILKIKEDAEMAIIEMGANHLKEIESYCVYAMPTHGLITNCGKAHLEGFGSEEGIRRGKGELFDYLRTHNGTAFIMKDYDYLVEMSRGINTVNTYGTAGAGITGNVVNNSDLLEVAISNGLKVDNIHTRLVGDYNLPNVLAAIAIGHYFKVPAEKIKAALENYTPSNSRSQLLKKDGNTIILDAYNANPSSMKVAVENFARMEGTGKVLLLGAMMELGQESKKEHEALVSLLQQFKWRSVVLVGGDFKNITHPFIYFDTAAAAKEWLQQQALHNAAILVKGSRSIKMETVLE